MTVKAKRLKIPKPLKRPLGESLLCLLFLIACMCEVVESIFAAIRDAIAEQYGEWQGWRMELGFRTEKYVGRWATHELQRRPSREDKTPKETS